MGDCPRNKEKVTRDFVSGDSGSYNSVLKLSITTSEPKLNRSCLPIRYLSIPLVKTTGNMRWV